MRVGEQVVEHLADALLGRPSRRGARGRSTATGTPYSSAKGRAASTASSDQRGEVDRRALQLEAALADLGHLEQVGHQRLGAGSALRWTTRSWAVTSAGRPSWSQSISR